MSETDRVIMSGTFNDELLHIIICGVQQFNMVDRNIVCGCGLAPLAMAGEAPTTANQPMQCLLLFFFFLGINMSFVIRYLIYSNKNRYFISYFVIQIY